VHISAGSCERVFVKRGLRVLVLAIVVGCLFAPARASAEIVEFTSGRTLSVKSHRIEGELAVLVLRTGGEVTCAARLIASVRPDEVPYPEPPAAAAEDDDEPTPPRYAEAIQAAAEKYGLDARLLTAVIQVESNFMHRARSPKGAMGLMQLMPATARQYAVDDPFDPSANIEAGARHLKSLLDRFDLRLALAAYNAGEGAVTRYGGVPPYPETREYVKRVLGLLRSARQSS
jgi:transglycosylase-like protein with SLT domain